MFEFKKNGDTLCIKINSTRFDAGLTGKFKASLEENTLGDEKYISVDLGKVEFIDSSGIGSLLDIQKCLREGSEPITLLNTQPAVHSIIELLRLHRVFRLTAHKN